MGLHFYATGDLKVPEAGKVQEKYESQPDKLRWAMKPVFLNHLLQSEEKIIYVDNDIFFFATAHFIFEQLEQHSVLLTPHWFPENPYPESEHFLNTFQIGLYNAGFFACSRKALPTLHWWTHLCLFAMERNLPQGLFDDQRYLDAVPVINETAGIVRHRGCNIGSWNVHQNKRVRTGDEVLINGTFPVIFIHFNNETIKHIANGNDNMLLPYLDKYRKAFALTGKQLDHFKEQASGVGFGPVQQIKRKVRLRTRVRNLLIHLSQKL
jgi:hypothetical protein